MDTKIKVKVNGKRISGIIKETLRTAIVPLTETTAELIPQPIAERIEAPLPKTLGGIVSRLCNIYKIGYSSAISETGSVLNMSRTYSTKTSQGTISIVVAAVKWLLKH